MIAGDDKNNNNNRAKKRLVALMGMAAMGLLAASIAVIGSAQFSIQQQGGERGRGGGGGSNLITITGTASDERITISEDNHQSEICTFAGVAVSGSGVTYLGPVGLCPDNEAYGWDISPNPDGIDTIYRLEGNAISIGGAGNADRVRVDDGSETDNDVYSLDVNQFAIFDGPGDDRYNLVGDSVDAGESLGYSDSSGIDRVTFGDRE